MSERSDPRTLLERLIQESDRTVEEHCADFQRRAHELSERGATLSGRQLGRWMAGQVDTARPASRRVAKDLWGHSFKKLLSDCGIDRNIGQVASISGAIELVSAATPSAMSPGA